jgi:hypothetical protein
LKKNAREPPDDEGHLNEISGRSFSSSIAFQALTGRGAAGRPGGPEHPRGAMPYL